MNESIHPEGFVSQRHQHTTVVSLCVPIHGAVHKVGELLSCVSKFRSFPYEVVLAGETLTAADAEMLRDWQCRLNRVCYVAIAKPHSEADLVYATHRAASGDYIICLPDDSIPIEEGIFSAKQILDCDLSCAAVYGGWRLISDESGQKEQREKSHSGAVCIALAQLCEGYSQIQKLALPLVRQKALQDQIAATLVHHPLSLHDAIRFRRHGTLVSLPVHMARLRRPPGNFGDKMTSQQLEAYLSDFELLLSDMTDLTMQEAVTLFARHNVHTYLAAVQRAVDAHDYLEGRRLLMKAMAYRIDGVQSIAIDFEKKHLGDVVAAYLFELCRLNPAIERVVLERSFEAETYIPLMEATLAGRAALVTVTKDALLALPASESDLVITQDAATMAQRLATTPGANPAKHRCLDDLVEACSLF